MRDLQALRVSSLGMAGRMRRLEATCTAANKHARTRRRHNGTRPSCGPAASSPYRRDRAAFAFVCLCSGRPARVGTEYREPCALLQAGVEAPRIPISHSSGRVSARAGAARRSSRLTMGPCRSPPLIPHFAVGSIGIQDAWMTSQSQRAVAHRRTPRLICRGTAADGAPDISCAD